MNKNLKSLLLRYGITAFVGLMIMWTVLSLHGYSTASTVLDKYRILTDAFSIPGILIVMLGTLVWISNQGMFSGFTFVMGRMFRALIPLGRNKENKTYYEYVQEKREKGQASGYGFLFIVGGAFCAVSAVFMILFYSI